jgi:flagellar assembly factor FliW
MLLEFNSLVRGLTTLLVVNPFNLKGSYNFYIDFSVHHGGRL